MSLRPWYNKDTNYQTNAKSVMDYLARTNKFLEVLIEDYEIFQELVIEELERIKFNAEMEVSDILLNWLDDGTLERIINDEVFGNKADTDWVNEQLNQLRSEIELKANRIDVTNELNTLENKVDHSLKVLFPNGSNDTEQIKNALQDYDRVVLSDGVFHCNVDVNVDNKELYGKQATIKPINDTYALIINGHGNTIHSLNIEIPSSSQSRYGLNIIGDYNTLRNTKVNAVTSFPMGSNISYTPLVLISGHLNTIENNELFNGGTGVAVQNGEYNTIQNNSVHHNTMGIRNDPTSKDVKILNNSVHHNNVTNVTGADGILLHRNGTGAIVQGNHISYNGEHGIYSQGDNTIISNNIVSHNGVSGIKSGAHQTQLHDFFGDIYISSNNTIENNAVYSNGSDGIYYQSPFDDIVIQNNHVYNNGSEGIKTVTMGTSADDILGSLSIKGNKSQSLWITGSRNVVIQGNDVEGSIYTQAKGTESEDRMIEPLVKDNIMGILQLSRVRHAKIVGNTVKQQFSISEHDYAVIQDNYIVTNQNINASRLRTWLNNRVIFKDGTHFTSFGSVSRCSGNYFESINLEDDYICSTVANQAIDGLQFTNNHLATGLKGLFIETYSSNVLISNNYFEGGSTETSVRLRGADSLVLNNTSNGNVSVNFHVNGIGKNNKLSFVNTPSSTYVISDNL